ncbi:MAG: replication protein RepA [Candidatus Aenigmarchaeota archaeon]|nr:replication protein RepA [Candidatus Aenigmarchaeota archaeon]NIP41057.1 replication protein RepA [Candidatus Aenigmarchaeota archaeon]NIQ17459.1 replication protein RepA [Candidatus Aenigmarchaeota archaeon]NIS73653.1 replication protein RepA [Candidatus Aenigmarchaeota archaeon]
MPETLEGFVSPRRLPSIGRRVSEIGKGDVRVRLLGTVIDRKDNVIVIDDGTGKINVTFEEPVNFDANRLVRVFGRAIPMEEGFEIQGEVIQDMKDLDLDLYRKVNELEKANV